MADEKDKQSKPVEEGSGEQEKPAKPRRSAAAKKPAASKEEKPKRTRARAKPKADEKPKTTTRRRAAPKAAAKAPEAEVEAEVDEKAAEQPEKPAAKAPARRRAAAPKPEAPKMPPVRPVVTARAKYVRSSARKARLVIDHVRGKPIGEARAVLRHSPRGVARDLERLLASAVANAENNHDLVGDDLYVKDIYADEGPTLKRYRARAQGRAYRIRKRTSHLTVALTPKE
jgi:large subunit ribosomal protein L22